MTPEGRVKKMVIKALDSLGDGCYRFMPVQSGYGSQTLDYLACIRGRFVAIETKAPGKKLTPMQEITKRNIINAGGIVLVVWDEGSMAIAARIILALEYDTHDRDDQRTRAAALPAEAARLYEQHLREVEPAQAPDDAAGGDHGAPRAKPKRRAKPKAGGHDQRVTAAVTDNERDQQDPAVDWLRRDFGLAATHRPLFDDNDGGWI